MLHFFKKYEFSLPYEIIIANNSKGHPSLDAIMETELGKDVKVVDGDPDLPSHAQGYSLCQEVADSDWYFTTETDAWPTRHGWSEEWVKASADYSLIGPYMELAGGIFVHPCGALVNEHLIDAVKRWQASHQDWAFIPGAAQALGLSDKAFHVVGRHDWIAEQPTGRFTPEMDKNMATWERMGPWQETRMFRDDSFETYPQRRNGVFTPTAGKNTYNVIGLEPGEFMSWYADEHNFTVKHAPFTVTWMQGREGRQAAHSDIFGGFRHIWAGTSSLGPGLDEEVREFKMGQMDYYWQQVPEDIRKYIEKKEAATA